jgi:phosphatidylinositol alpha-1,6-mannosyltransferase
MAWEHTPVSERVDDQAAVGGVRIEAMASPGAGAGPGPPEIPRTLVVTNDYPPRVGGVQQYVWNLVRSLPADRVEVLAPRWEGWREHDAAEPVQTHRWPATSIWPTDDVARRVRSLVADRGIEAVLFGHGLLAAIGPRAGVPYVALTHGWEVWLARTPGLATVLRNGLRRASATTAVSRFTERRIRGSLGLGEPFHLLYPGVDPGRFSPHVDGSAVRGAYGPDGAPMVLCVSRLVPRKGQDTLIRGMELLRALVPEAILVIAGGGPDRARLEGLARDAPSGSVVFAGEVSDADLPAHYAACDVFAMPCRSRWMGLEVEGFGIVYLEAGASSKPVVAGRSGGADEAVEDGTTGLLVEGDEPKATALAVAQLLTDGPRAGRFGGAGRARVEREFTWTRQAERLASLLRDAAGA